MESVVNVVVGENLVAYLFSISKSSYNIFCIKSETTLQ